MDGEFIGDCTDAYKEFIEGTDTPGVFLAKHISLNDPYKRFVNFIVDLKSGLQCKKNPTLFSDEHVAILLFVILYYIYIRRKG